MTCSPAREVIQEWSTLPFIWGRTDCCQFAGAMVEAIHGHNPMKPFLYDSESQALAIIQGFGGLESAMRSTLGAVSNDCESDGTVTIHKTILGYMAGVIFDGRCLVKTEKSITDWPLSWSILRWDCATSSSSGI